MKIWIKKQLAKFKAWIISLLVALGLMTGAVMAATVNFNYTPATEYTDGSPMPLSDIDFTRLYCDGVLVDEEPGADGDFSVLLGFGSHDCYGTHVVLIATTPESAPSNMITKVVRPPQPGSLIMDEPI